MVQLYGTATMATYCPGIVFTAKSLFYYAQMSVALGKRIQVPLAAARTRFNPQILSKNPVVLSQCCILWKTRPADVEERVNVPC